MVIDHCPRNLVTLTEVDLDGKGVPGMVRSFVSEGANLAWLTLLRNHENKTIEWLLSFDGHFDRLRWMEAVTPSHLSSNPEEKIYEIWDCPLVVTVQDYDAQDGDEVNLVKGDKANVLRKLSNSGKFRLQWKPLIMTPLYMTNRLLLQNPPVPNFYNTEPTA